MELSVVATQVCRACGERKPIEEFDLRGDTGRRRNHCKSCRREYQADRYRRCTPASSRSTRLIGAAETFRCTRCGEWKQSDDFPTRAKGSAFLHSWCKACFTTYKAERHQRNHEKEMRRIRRNQAATVSANRARALEYLLTHPCVDCGERDPVVLDFDHVHGDKIADVSVMISNGWPWRKVEAEIAKCDVRCANDHRRVTKKRREEKKRTITDGMSPLPRPRTGSNRRPAVP